LESVESSPSLLANHAREQKSNKRLKVRTITRETKREGQRKAKRHTALGTQKKGRER
jgi:hypothetical protein